MAKVTFAVRPMVAIQVRGERTPRTARFPAVHADGGLIVRLLQWQLQHCILPLESHSGVGTNYGCYTAADAERVTVWLKAQGASRRGWTKRR